MEEDPKNKKKDANWSVTSDKNPVTMETTISSKIRYENGTIDKELYTIPERNIAQASKHSIMADLHEHMKAVEKTKRKAEIGNNEESSK